MTTNLWTISRLNALLILTCLAIPMKSSAASEKTLFDFKRATNAPVWQVVNDDVMGGGSMSQLQVLTNNMALFSGKVSLENNGGFASVRSGPAPEDFTGLEAFVIRVRGDGRRYKFTVRTEPRFNTPFYQSTFPTLAGKWEEHRLPFKDFVPTFRGRVLKDLPPLDPGKAPSLGFLIADKQAGTFRLEIDWIKASPAKPDSNLHK